MIEAVGYNECKLSRFLNSINIKAKSHQVSSVAFNTALSFTLLEATSRGIVKGELMIDRISFLRSALRGRLLKRRAIARQLLSG
jgi:glucose-6-phosphate-specific signal transduction histidine kinase